MAARFEERNKKYIIIIKLSDGSREEHAIGMNGKYEMSKEGLFGLPVAVKGHWINDTCLAIDYNESCRIQDYKLLVIFSDKSIALTVNEQTKGIHTTMIGKYP